MRKGKFGGVGGGSGGREVEFSTSGGYFVWRYVGDVAWINLFPIPADGNNGTNGREVQISLLEDGNIAWRYVGDVAWTNIIHISALIGPEGPPGSNGSNGADGVTPHIGVNGNWFIGAADTGISATGPAGANGANGAAGRGVVSILLTSTVGKVKTYTITYTDATTSTFDVIDGADGTESNYHELCLDFTDDLEFTYNVPFPCKFTSQWSENTAATLSIALNTNLAQCDKLTVTPTAVGLVKLIGEKIV